MTVTLHNGVVTRAPTTVSDGLTVSVPDGNYMGRMAYQVPSFRPKITAEGGVRFPIVGDPALVATDNENNKATWLVEWQHADTSTYTSATLANLSSLIESNVYSQDVGDGTNTVYTVTHNLGTRDIAVLVTESSAPYSRVYPAVDLTTPNSITITFGQIATTNQYHVVCARGAGGASAPSDITTSQIADAAITTPKIADGAITLAKLPAIPHARVTRTASLAIPNATYTAITFDAVVNASGVTWNSATRLTAPSAGVYLAEASLLYNPTAGGGHRLCHLAINGGSSFAYGGLGGVTFTAANAQRANAVGVTRLAANDYVEALAYQDCGVPLNIYGPGGEAYFSLTRLGS